MIEDLIEAIFRIKRGDSELRDQSPLIANSPFDKESRRFVTWICAGIILLMVIASYIWWRLS